jgi:hypothetical protein
MAKEMNPWQTICIILIKIYRGETNDGYGFQQTKKNGHDLPALRWEDDI